MAIDSNRKLLEELEQALTDDFDKSLIRSYANNFDYSDLERTFREQLTQEVSQSDED